MISPSILTPSFGRTLTKPKFASLISLPTRVVLEFTLNVLSITLFILRIGIKPNAPIRPP